nr:uncharacterized protein LOC127293687 [Lolium perenne]
MVADERREGRWLDFQIEPPAFMLCTHQRLSCRESGREETIERIGCMSRMEIEQNIEHCVYIQCDFAEFRLVQKAGVFVVTFLGSYHCGFSQVYGRHKSQNKHLDDSNKHKYEGDIVCMKRLSKNQLFTKLDASTSNPYQPRQT